MRLGARSVGAGHGHGFLPGYGAWGMQRQGHGAFGGLVAHRGMLFGLGRVGLGRFKGE